MVRKYIKNTKRLVKNTIIIFILGVILISAYYLLGFNSNPLVYYSSIIVAVIFGLHLWLIFMSFHIKHKKK